MFLGSVDFKSGWTTVWGNIQTAVGTGLTTLLASIGVVLVVAAMLKWLWDRRRPGNNQGHHALLVTFVIGAICCGPSIVMPVLLGIADVVTNALVGFFGNL